MKANFKSIIMLVVTVAVIVTAVSFFTQNRDKGEELVYSELVELFEYDLVKSYEVDGNLNMTLVIFTPDLNEDKTYKLDENDKAIYKLKQDGSPLTEKREYKLGYNFQLTQINEIAQSCERLELYEYLHRTAYA